MPRHLSGITAVRCSPSRPAVDRSIVTRDVAPRPQLRRGAGVVGVLTSALVGGGLVAGHSEVGGDTVHIEELALQAFTTSGDTGPTVTPELAMPAASSTGSARAVVEPPPPVDVDAIIGAADGAVGDALAAQRQRAEKRAAADRPDGGDVASSDGGGPAGCAAGAEGFGAVASSVATAGETLRCMFGVDTVYGVAGRSNASDHPKGEALDFMVDQATGEKLAAYARQNSDELGISYVIYRQRIDTGSGWESMEDRGGITANHMDHVHISFD